MIFKPATWALLVVLYLVGSVLLCKVAKLTSNIREYPSFRNLAKCMTLTWASVLEIPINKMPKTQILRIIFFFWIAYCLVISSIYKSSLISFMTEPRLEASIETFHQLLESRLPLGYTVGLAEYFESRIQSSLVYCSDINWCLTYVAHHNNMSLVSDEWYVKYLIPIHFLDGNGISLLEILDEYVISYHVVMILSKGHVLLDRFNIIISRITEGGLLVKWMRDINMNRTLGDAAYSNDEWRRLTLIHLQGPLFLLLFGLGVSFVTLLLEVVCKKRLFCV
ncbi:hypothetical protein L9F63_027421 [Diploptera punctata]|nr:hypothetical protein L9F63_027421 [Diploptera punctata]